VGWRLSSSFIIEDHRYLENVVKCENTSSLFMDNNQQDNCHNLHFFSAKVLITFSSFRASTPHCSRRYILSRLGEDVLCVATDGDFRRYTDFAGRLALVCLIPWDCCFEMLVQNGPDLV